jgi:acyl carrier protein
MPASRDNLLLVQTLTNEEVRSVVRGIIFEIAPNPGRSPAGEVLLVEDLEYHSLALLELAFALEDEFDLPPIDEESVLTIRSAQDLEDYVVLQVAAK